MSDAGNSDMGVMKRMQEHDQAFKELTVDAVAIKMPRLQVRQTHAHTHTNTHTHTTHTHTRCDVIPSSRNEPGIV